MKEAYIAEAPAIVDRFANEGFVTDHDWEGCPWDPEFDEHRDRLTLSKQTCLHRSKEKGEAEEKVQDKKDEEVEEKKKTKKATKKKEEKKMVFDLCWFLT